MGILQVKELKIAHMLMLHSIIVRLFVHLHVQRGRARGARGPRTAVCGRRAVSETIEIYKLGILKHLTEI